MDVIEESTSKDQKEDLKDVFSALSSHIPDSLNVQVNDISTEDKVAEHNAEIIKAYINSENQHLEQQKPIATIIAVICGIQLIAFNILIYFVVLKDYDIETRTLLLDFMKYYTGAVIVEMLGMCLIVVRGIYSMSIGKMAEHIIKGINKKKQRG